ncbi:hypothetical protein GM415_02250 [Pseudodesulfovibrio cashew]|uniref:MBOAT family protein n=1 Tax=Pseudodesulfovibrio cashew TaxID=2678688 RepID=A0A6I6J8V0_9BACT|nr:MBOAT family O-acyltransferase [Pseudodesulfovibrio cashew]QGY39005.1 hypothetical protein GM415_02250 [Pseudodesulfovibrio cashew]
MIYSSFEFVALLGFVGILLQYTSQAARKWVLLLFSAVFVCWSGLVTTIVLCLVISLIWAVLSLARRYSERSQLITACGIGLLVGNLFMWKYWGWVASLASLSLDGWETSFFISHQLPIGISFYTLQGIAYLIDNTRGETKPISFTEFVLFQSLFAQLIAGPIVRHNELIPQVHALPRAQERDVLKGSELFILGLFKKMVLADRVAQVIDPIFAAPEQFDPVTLWMAILLYSVQIWGDFSGYMDMGRGAALICGIYLPKNFYAPYLAHSPSEFWRRWHITLGRWLRDYVYFPMGGSRGSAWRTIINLMATMLLCGFWHGAAWNFVIWGAYHGLLLTLHRVARLFVRLPKPMAIGVTFIFVVFGWLIFRVENLETLGSILTSFLDAGAYRTLFSAPIDIRCIAALALALAIQAGETAFPLLGKMWLELRLEARATVAGLLLFAAIYYRGTAAPFIYFAF